MGGAIHDLFVDPALRIFLFLDALPQGLVWGGVLAILALLAWLKFRWPEVPKQKTSGKGAEDIAGVAELAVLLKRARFSPWARQRLRARLMHLAVALRCEQEKICPDKAWADIKQGHWPKSSVARAFFRGEEKTSFSQALTRVVEELERYAGGGEW